MQPDGTNRKLYNMQTDHRETTNVVNKELAVTTELTEKLQSWYNEYVHHKVSSK